MNWLGHISLTAILTSVFIGLISWGIRTLPLNILRFFRKHKGEFKYSSFGKRRILFDKKGDTRVTIGVLAAIQNKEGHPLLIKGGNKNQRDTLWKPIGGAIKIDKDIRKLLKNDYSFDKNTKYNAKKNDFRIFINDLSSNRLIQKIIHSKTYNYYKLELIREMEEELKISTKDIMDIFKFGKIQSSHFLYKDSADSHLQVRDYSQQIVIDVQVKDQVKLGDILKGNKSVKFIDLKNGNYNVALTSHWLSLIEKVKIKQK